MKKFGSKKFITYIFTIIVLGTPFFSEASSKHTDFILSEHIFLFAILVIGAFFGVMYISQNWLHKKIKPVNLTHLPTNKYPLIVQYEPPKGINSAEAGLLFNCRVDPVDLTSLFYQWVNDKLIHINYTSDESDSKKIKNITLVKLRDIPETYPYYEKELFNNVFKGYSKSRLIDKNSDLSRAITLEGLEDFGLCKHWLRRGGKFSFGSIILSLIFIALIVLCFYYFKWLGIIPLALFIPIFFGIISKQNDKIRLTKAGKEITAHVMGYAKFIEKCDKNILEKFLEKDPLFIDKTLPYAVAFGLETQFIEKVTPLLKDIEQSWLSQKSYTTFPVIGSASLIRMSLSKIWNNGKVLQHGARYLYAKSNYGKSWGNYNQSQGNQNRRSRDFGKVTYDKSLGFKIGSILLKGGKLFKKGGGGGGGGGKSW